MLRRDATLLAAHALYALPLAGERLLGVLPHCVPLAVLRTDLVGPARAQVALDALEGEPRVRRVRARYVAHEIRRAHDLARPVRESRRREVVVRAIDDVVLERHPAHRRRRVALRPPAANRSR